MRTLSTSLSLKLEAGVTTLAQAWRLTRKDGHIVAVTQHDRELVFDGTTFKAAGCFVGSDLELEFDLAPDRTALSGALSADAITEADLALGRWQDADVEGFQVDWENPSDFIALWSGKIAGATWQGIGFELDIVGIEAVLSTNIGRVYARTCDAILGDARCGVDMLNNSYSAIVSLIEQNSDRVLIISAPLGKVVADYANGRLLVTSGLAVDWQCDLSAIDILSNGQTNQWRVALARPMPVPVSVGDSIKLFVGCDKTFPTCKARFANGLNFRGQPTLPGDDAVFSGPSQSGNTGGKR